MSLFDRFTPKSPKTPGNSRSASISRTNSTAESKLKGAVGDIYNDDWLVFFPGLGVTMLTWVDVAKAQVRQHVATCCYGDLFGTEESDTIPGEIVIRTDSVVGDKATDIELMPVSNYDASFVGIDYDRKTRVAPWRAPQDVIPQTVWNNVPIDPVDEVSLKGSSSYCSSSSDSDCRSEAKSIIVDINDSL